MDLLGNKKLFPVKMTSNVQVSEIIMLLTANRNLKISNLVTKTKSFVHF